MSNYNQVVEASSAKGTSAAGTTQINRDSRGVVLSISKTANSGTSPTVTIKVQGSANGTDWYDITGATTAAISANGTTTLTVCPGVPVTANVSTSQPLPRLWRIYWTIGGSDTPTVTFSVDAAMIQ